MKQIWLLTFALIEIVSTQTATAAKPRRTPEEEAKIIAKHLKPIPDAEWKTIAGPKSSEKYSIAKGDTLSDISKRLFGDTKYWPKVWALNNDTITNPHRIKPGNMIAFLPGTGSSLPSVTIASASDQGSPVQFSSEVPNVTHKSTARSTEWKQLPLQSWEHFSLPPKIEVDPLGFDKRSKIPIPRANGFDPELVPATEKLPILGHIVGARSESQYLAINDTVYIEAEAPIHTGETYALTQSPYLLKSTKSDRAGYSYLVLGKVKILGVKDNLFIGTILTARNYISRGSLLMALPPKVPEMDPIPGPKPLGGTLLIDHNISTYTSAQHKEVLIDRGSDDGVKPGMVFRVYEHFDPSNNKKLTDSQFIIDGDILVTQVSPSFCSGLVIHMNSPIYDNSSVVLMTDVDDFINRKGYNEKGLREDKDELDQLDDRNNLGSDEKKELKQLEHWNGNPADGGDKSSLPPPPPKEDASSPPPPPQDGESTPPPPPGDSTPPPPPKEGEANPPPPPATESNSHTDGDNPLPPPPPSGDMLPPPSTNVEPGTSQPSSGSEPPPPPPPAPPSP